MKVTLVIEYPDIADPDSEAANNLLDLYFDKYDLRRLADEWDAESVTLDEVAQ